MSYRVIFFGVYPSLLPCADERVRYEREFGARDEAEAVFRDEPSAVEIQRWEPQIKGWVGLEVRDRK